MKLDSDKPIKDMLKDELFNAFQEITKNSFKLFLDDHPRRNLEKDTSDMIETIRRRQKAYDAAYDMINQLTFN